MRTTRYVYWQEDGGWLGYLEEFPDYWTQGETLDDLIEHLKDLFLDLSGGKIPGARQVGELVFP
ncbi:MAG TPA: type II toxin-antitoxin system HicB family antitoxin [Isosphaeraceae bacterium]|nr:type II toxin-antitoxin system HicB family antitoxin [Isosphaeraceae bacterium]